ncbi:MAG: HAD family phosphatase [Lactobacillales bacterium]|jgi:HAD superfamily hydrolase (TIGR01509 family)|nr:HAD family phosphatase [Lactobacillales bacterium]
MKKTLVIFDLDGTLADTEMVVARAKHDTFLAECGVDIPVMEYADLFSGLSRHNQEALLEKKYGIRYTDDLREKSDALCRLRRAQMSPLPGIYELIAALKTHGIDFCIASGSSLPTMQATLDTIGLADFFPESARFSGRMVTHGKPAPDLFLLAAQKMGYDPKNCIVVEDSAAGLQAAAAAGMKRIPFLYATHTAGGNYRAGINALLEKGEKTADTPARLLQIILES